LILGALLAALGLIVCARGLALEGKRIERVRLRPLLLVLAAIGAFAASVESAGIVITTILLVAIGSAASPESRPGEVAALTALLLGLSVGVFTYGLGLPFRIFPG
jgi:hypothetical protein